MERLGCHVGQVILSVAIAATFDANFLPDRTIPYHDQLPHALGIRAAVSAWKHRNDPDEDRNAVDGDPAILAVTAVTFANSGDNIGVYVIVFLILLAGRTVAGRYLATQLVMTKAT